MVLNQNTPNKLGGSMSAKERFLETYEEEHRKTVKVLKAFPADQQELRPHPRMRTARELAWVFVQERGLGALVLSGKFGQGPPGQIPPAPATWAEVLGALEKAHQDFGKLVRSMSEEELGQKVKFLTGPKQVGDFERLKFCWFLLHDQIHHRGQFTIYLRMAGAKVPSIYGPSGDEPWS
jgi:uncharacterized damage-inducible protein DinB